MKQLVAVLLLLTCCTARSEGFGWYGQSFSYPPFMSLFSEARTDSTVVSSMLREARICSDKEDPSTTEKSLREMLATGWKPGAVKSKNSDAWEAFSALASDVCSSVAPELTFSIQMGRFDTALFSHALDKVPDKKKSPLRHFDNFGREPWAQESHSNCADVHEGSNARGASQSSCAPLYLILTPDEVQTLSDDLAHAVPLLEARERDAYRQLVGLVTSSARERRAIFFRAFD